AYYFIPNYEKFIKILQLTFWPLLGVVIWILFRHYGHSFSFETSNIVVYPIFRNHVNSASTMVLFLPFVWLLFQTTQKQLLKWVYGFALLVFIMGIYFSYTRVAILCLPIALAMYFIVRYTLIKWALIAATIFFGTVIYFVATNNRYVNFAPNFEKTISHTEFDNLLEATYKLEDISTMERVYRWVAGAHMLKERPLLGFGPATFYTNYKDYTVRIFETYVSNNPDQSGIHSYYLMTAVEQGLVGLIILLTMIAVILLIGEKVYHQCTNTLAKNSIAACIVSIVIILVINLINDTLEVDKIGPYFFTAMAIIGMEYGRQQQSK
nr:O-antigen ligase family protein [Saprospiraceae bacterium]